MAILARCVIIKNKPADDKKGMQNYIYPAFKKFLAGQGLNLSYFSPASCEETPQGRGFLARVMSSLFGEILTESRTLLALVCCSSDSSTRQI